MCREERRGSQIYQIETTNFGADRWTTLCSRIVWASKQSEHGLDQDLKAFYSFLWPIVGE